MLYTRKSSNLCLEISLLEIKYFDMSIIILPFLSPDKKTGIYHNSGGDTNFKTKHDLLAQGLTSHPGPRMVVLVVLMVLVVPIVSHYT